MNANKLNKLHENMFSVITYKKARGRGGEEESRLSLCDGWLMLLLQRGRKKKRQLAQYFNKLKPNPRQPMGTHSYYTESRNVKSPH